MAKRKSTGKRQRFNIFKRDKFTCQYCGRTPPTVVLVVDHVLPVAAGGETVEHNLLTSCETCNQGKAAGLLTDVPQAIDGILEKQVERREQLAEYNLYLLEAREKENDVIRDLGLYWCNRLTDEKDRWAFGDARQASIRVFLRRMPTAELYDAIDIALSRVSAALKADEKAWKYFCGICWSKIREREGDLP